MLKKKKNSWANQIDIEDIVHFSNNPTLATQGNNECYGIL